MSGEYLSQDISEFVQIDKVEVTQFDEQIDTLTDKPEKMQLEILIRTYAKELALSGIEDSLRESRLLMEAANKITITEQLLKPELVLSQSQMEKFLEYVYARKERIPFSYITKHKEFYGRQFRVDNCLIPRPETELIVDLVLNEAENRFEKDCNILDLCTGSGCLGISIYLELKNKLNLNMSLTLTDISEAALSTCRKNLSSLEINTENVRAVKTDLFPDLKDVPSNFFDLVVANPPYINQADLEKLEPEVISNEPKIALDGGLDGLNFYRRIANEIKDFLAKDKQTVLIMEHGAGQRTEIIEIFKRSDLIIEEIFEVNDWQQHDRILGFCLSF